MLLKYVLLQHGAKYGLLKKGAQCFTKKINTFQVGGTFNKTLLQIYCLLLSLVEAEFWNLVNIWQS